MSDALKVAVIGASGIGQHHARWHHLSGSQVVAFVGTSDASCARTEAQLKNYFGFDGRAYTDVAHMLETEQPDVVDVSSPFHLHRDHAVMAFEAGCHVVCEKPLCWDMAKDLDAIVADGEAVVAAAEQANKSLVVSAQYPAVIPIYRDFYARVNGQWDKIASIEMEMEVKGRKGAKTREDIWIDLASHPLSLVVGLLHGGEIDWEQASCTICERENRATFGVKTSEGMCDVQIVLRDIDEGVPMRRFGVNGFWVDWEGFADACGIYRARLAHGDETVVCNDFMHILIDEFGQFLRGEGGRVVVSGLDGLKNLKYQIALLKRATHIQ